MTRNGRLRSAWVRRPLSDMKTLTMRDLNRRTASVLDAVEKGESFEVRRHGRAVGYLTQAAPAGRSREDSGYYTAQQKGGQKNNRDRMTGFRE